MLITRVDEIINDDLFIDLGALLGAPITLKCEGFNFGGSIKLKAAVSMIDAAESSGRLRPDSVLVESSSGNLGVALSIIAASRGYDFLCVTDARANVTNTQYIRATGARVVVIEETRPGQDLLAGRIDYIQRLCRADDRVVWLNQYANEENWRAHYRTTGPAIAKAFPEVGAVYIGAGTTGTLMGCARYLREIGHPARIVAVDSVGSVALDGGTPAPRHIPGIGSSRRPEIFDGSLVDDVVHVEEADTIRMCRRLVRSGFLFGGSTGTVLAGALEHRRRHGLAGTDTGLAIAPDLGERYLSTMYDDSWVEARFGRVPLEQP